MVFRVAKIQALCPKTGVRPTTHILLRRMKTILPGILLASIAFLTAPHARAQDDYFRDLESPREIAPVVQLNPAAGRALQPRRRAVALQRRRRRRLRVQRQRQPLRPRPAERLHLPPLAQYRQRLADLRPEHAPVLARDELCEIFHPLRVRQPRGAFFAQLRTGHDGPGGPGVDHAPGPLFLPGRSLRHPDHQQHRGLSQV